MDFVSCVIVDNDGVVVCTIVAGAVSVVVAG